MATATIASSSLTYQTIDPDHDPAFEFSKFDQKIEPRSINYLALPNLMSKCGSNIKQIFANV